MKVDVSKGHYVGEKWFLKIAYRKYETDVNFFDEYVSFSQGHAFAIVKEKTETKINYKDINAVEKNKKHSIPNVVVALIIVALALITQAYVAILAAALLLFIGKTAVVNVKHNGGEYIIPVEFMSEAQELSDKINMAMNQYRN